MKTIVSVLLLSLAAPGVAGAAKPYEVIRAGDSEMTCDQLRTEINALNSAVQTAQDEQAKRESRGRMAKGVLGGIAGSALSVAPSLLGGKLGGGMTQYALNGALQSIQSSAAQAPSAAEPSAGPKPAPPEQKRLEHMSELYRGGGC